MNNKILLLLPTCFVLACSSIALNGQSIASNGKQLSSYGMNENELHTIGVSSKNTGDPDKVTAVNNHFEDIPNGENDTLVFQFGSCALRLPAITQSHFRIFKTMAKDDADFTIWMGDHTYFLGRKDWGSAAGMRANYARQRKPKSMRALLDAHPQYAIWDDHDFGPNNADGTFPYKDTALMVFKEMWANPTHGLPDVPGIFFNVRHSDAEFIFTDGRYHNIENKQMFGPEQLKWMEETLKASTARFKFIICGSQALNNHEEAENLYHSKEEYEGLLNFIKENNISGVIFLSGDRHFAEMNKLEREGTYPLYEITSSSLTSVYIPIQLENPHRVPGTFEKHHNYGRITLYGSGEERTLKMDLIGERGKVFWTREIKAKELRMEN